MEKSLKNIENIQIVLVNPQDGKNIGFVCRAMKTMGITSLAIVSARNIDFKTAAITAIHASDILKNCKIFPQLDLALKNSCFIAGITRRKGRFRKYFSYTPEEVAKKICQIKTV